MTLHPPTRRRRAALAVVGALTVVAGAVLGITRPWMPPVETAPVAAAVDSGIAPIPLALGEHPTVLVFGDSWTYGSAATEPTLGYAYLLADLIQGETVVDGVRGSGYQKPGVDGPTYGERIAALDADINPDAVIIEGSINDRREDPAGFVPAVNAAWDALTTKFPETPIIVMGPAPHELPVGATTARIDRDLATLAASRGWWYISPVQDRWITEANYLDVIDVGAGRKHPTDAGHRFLAEKVSDALQQFSDAPVTAADGTRLDPAK
ncbi:lipolytic enzyme, G-D-S-L [Microbacterium esteraromaticum]|uniref:Lipolytic enzyme, G-D-S-L n=1 Tax=Microbacterium esteraromaticum TaxID=57043 RepID=A0A1R4JH19_9MICO|nr:SGNH/GDSL hydrolase family protein [Microbacterium esteraromaticum]SJN31521.1 lipolytic enzyme, G-D-S-L [Microbacterium esteraromaticum]